MDVLLASLVLFLRFSFPGAVALLGVFSLPLPPLLRPRRPWSCRPVQPAQASLLDLLQGRHGLPARRGEVEVARPARDGVVVDEVAPVVVVYPEGLLGAALQRQLLALRGYRRRH